MRLTETVRADIYLESELPRMLGVSKRQANRIVRQAGTKLGRIRVVTRGQVLAFLEQHRGEVEHEKEKGDG